MEQPRHGLRAPRSAGRGARRLSDGDAAGGAAREGELRAAARRQERASGQSRRPADRGQRSRRRRHHPR
ncbi:MAG TPA: hypothetical protein VHB97_01040 [Polyangia bacterium]|nr:hypothetical protein [Polyangia bacterium]